MRARLVFAMVTVLFLGMNVWLWRVEFAGRSRFSSSISPEMVWRKMVLAQDSSSLIISQSGQRIGFCRWHPTVLQHRGPGSESDDLSVEEMTQEVIGYTIDLDGHFLVDPTTRIRFNATLKLGTNFVWKQIDLRFMLRPDSWEFSADAEKERLRIRLEDDNGQRERVFKFSELDHPDRVLRRLGVGELAPLFAGLGTPLGRLQSTNLLPGVTWQAQRDRLPVGQAGIPVFRVQAGVFNRPQATVFTSLFGEVFRVELPGQVVLVNDAMNAL